VADTLPIEFDLDDPQPDDDNITDWCLERFRSHYGDASIGKDDIWEYLYGVMHAPDWRERYRHDLQRNLPRVPLAGDFEAFRAAGRALMDLHIGYETVPEWPGTCLVDGRPDEGDADPDAYRIDGRMRWGRATAAGDDRAVAEGAGSRTSRRPAGAGGRAEDRSVLEINGRCRLVGIPAEAHEYTVSGRSPLAWAIDSLRHKHDKASGITDDPNGWHVWADEPFNLIRHLRRLVTVATETANIVRSLPPSLPAPNAQPGLPNGGEGPSPASRRA